MKIVQQGLTFPQSMFVPAPTDLIPLTMLLDIVWCAVYGPYLNSGTSLLGLM